MNHNFVHLDYPTTHPGVERAEQALANIKRMGETFSPTRTSAAMLLAAIVAAFVVVADQLIGRVGGRRFVGRRGWPCGPLHLRRLGFLRALRQSLAFQIKTGLRRLVRQTRATTLRCAHVVYCANRYPSDG
jgi:hypothetical protein